jgi:hypothetical protein
MARNRVKRMRWLRVGNRGRIEIAASAARHPLQASSRGKPQHAVRVAGDREGRNGPSGNKAHAQAQPGGALGIDEVAFGYAGGFNQRLSVGLQRDRKTRIGHFDDDHVGRRVRRPQRGVIARDSKLDRVGKAEAPTPGKALLFVAGCFRGLGNAGLGVGMVLR